MKNKSVYYWDTSALASMLFGESEGKKLILWAKENTALPGYSSFFTWIELESALQRRVSQGEIALENLTTMQVAIESLSRNLAILWPDITVTGEAKNQIAKMGLKPGDALQLASALLAKREVGNVIFVCLDKKLSQAAIANGLECPEYS